MIKRLIFVTLMLVSMVFSVSAFEKANDAYAKEAEIITLVAEGSNSENEKVKENEIVISILGFKTSRWTITIEGESGTLLSGTFALNEAKNSDGRRLWFNGQGKNEETGESVKFRILSLDEAIYLMFDNPYNENPYKRGKLRMKYDCFVVVEDDPDTFILINKDWRSKKITDPGLKIATPKQLKICLSQNPYIK